MKCLPLAAVKVYRNRVISRMCHVIQELFANSNFWSKTKIFIPYLYWSHAMDTTTLRWRHNGCDGVSNHQPHHCLLNRLFGCRSKKASKLRITGLCAGNSPGPGTGEFPAQMARNAENVSIWWRHHEDVIRRWFPGAMPFLWRFLAPNGVRACICIQNSTFLRLKRSHTNITEGRGFLCKIKLWLFIYHQRHEAVCMYVTFPG